MNENEIRKVFQDLGIHDFPVYKNAEDFARNLMQQQPSKHDASWSNSSGVTFEQVASAVNPGTCYA